MSTGGASKGRSLPHYMHEPTACSVTFCSSFTKKLCCIHLSPQAAAATALVASQVSRMRYSARPSRQIAEHESPGANLIRPCWVCRRVGSPSSRGWRSDSGRGCLVTVVLFGNFRGVPCTWCSIRVDDAVLFEGLSSWDVVDVVGYV